MDTFQVVDRSCTNPIAKRVGYTEFERNFIQDRDTRELANVGKRQVLKVSCTEYNTVTYAFLKMELDMAATIRFHVDSWL